MGAAATPALAQRAATEQPLAQRAATGQPLAQRESPSALPHVQYLVQPLAQLSEQPSGVKPSVVKPYLQQLAQGVVQPTVRAAAQPLAPASAGPAQLTRAFQQARTHDPLYQSALAELDANRIGARAAGMAYYPTLQASSSRLDFEGGERRTITLSQPLISAEKYATMKEAEPRAQLAQATFLVREQDLALRLFKSVAEVIRAVESLSTNGSRIEALQQQAAAARKSYELGQGTITDLRDTQVRLDQARATDLSIKARRSAAERQYAAIVGSPLPPGAYMLARAKRDVRLAGAESYMPVALEINPIVVTARTNARLGELGVLRAKGAFLPTLSINAVQSKLSTGDNSSFTGLALTLPLQPASFLNLSGTEANLRRFNEMVRDAEQQVRLDVERLLTFVEAGRGETDIRLDAIRSAELSVVANEKSFAGGVRTTIDVLNSIQALYQTREEYVNTVLTLAENLLMVRLKVVMPVQECLNEVSSLLF